MALLTQENKYITVKADGTFEIYQSEAARLFIKQSTAAEEILLKYQEILENLAADFELRYYDPSRFEQLYGPWLREYQNYEYALQEHILTFKFPLMSEFFPDIEKTIPNIIEAGCICKSFSDVKTAYEAVKEAQYWGKTRDV